VKEFTQDEHKNVIWIESEVDNTTLFDDIPSISRPLSSGV
jgi:hypothetical protein